jgi:glycosyltransferase involved in cell wall biosynthesis
LRQRFEALGISSKEYFCINSKFSDVPNYLSAADVGIIFLNDSKIALATKTAEYLAMGLPVITNSCVLGAKELIQNHAVGLVFDLDSNIELLNDFLDNFSFKTEDIIRHCRKVSNDIFSNDLVANKYLDLYRSL